MESSSEVKRQIDSQERLYINIFYGIATIVLGISIAMMIFIDENGMVSEKPRWASLLSLLPELSGSIIIGIAVSLTFERLLKKSRTLKLTYQQKIEEDRLKNQKNSEEERIKNDAIQQRDFIADLTIRTRDEIHQLLNGFREIKVIDVFQKAKLYVETCSSIRVIGTAKQEYSDGEANKIISEYLDETIKRIKKTNLKYRRITTLNMNSKFLTHMNDLFTSNIKNEGNNYISDCQIQILDDFVPAYTYLIIDDKFLMLSLNYSEQPHNTYHYYTESKNIIDRFTLHFISVWNREKNLNKIIDNFEDFTYYHSYRKTIQDNFDNIKRAIRKFPNSSSHFQHHALAELESVATNVFLPLARKEIEITFHNHNSKLLNLLCLHLDNLKPGDKYETITFYDFWHNIIHFNNESFFENQNKESLKRGIKIKRILIIDPNDIERANTNLQYKIELGKILDLNFRLLENSQGNYDFKILIPNLNNIIHRDFYHFALMHSNSNNSKFHEKILFEPIYAQYNSSMKILFDYPNSHEQTNRRTRSTFEEKEGKLNKVNDMWEKQCLDPSHFNFLRQISPGNFANENSELVRNVLRNNCP